MASHSKAVCVAAIDLGTTHSGSAFAFVAKPDSARVKWMQQKCPTCILIRPDGKTLEAFGVEAESRYCELRHDGEHKKWYFFRSFKMSLWKKSIHKDTVLADECGRELPALTVFSLSIRFLTNRLLKNIGKDYAVFREEVLWVLTVPVSWNDSAKQFMRFAAEEDMHPDIDCNFASGEGQFTADIPPEMLTLALEPEAAYTYIRHLPELKNWERRQKEGNKYLVIDAGGGTIDITVLQVFADGGLKYTQTASAGNSGGAKVDEAFIDFLCDLIDKSAIQRMKDEYMEDYFELLSEFEKPKQLLNRDKNTVKIPVSLFDIATDVTGMTLEDKLQTTRYAKKVRVVAGKLRIDADVTRSFFSSSIHQIIEHVSCFLRKPECMGVAKIFMVGGYSESLLLQEVIRDRFSHMKIFVPQEAQLAVVHGAVIYGLKQHKTHPELKEDLKAQTSDRAKKDKDLYYYLHSSQLEFVS